MTIDQNVILTEKHINDEIDTMEEMREAAGHPLISVVVTTYNRPQALELCLWALSKQEFRNFEVVACDDGGEVPHMALARHEHELPDLKYVRQRDDGFRLAASRNNGIRLSRGEACLFLDGDVLLNPGALGAYAAAMERFDNQVAMAGRYRNLSPRMTATLMSASCPRHFGTWEAWADAEDAKDIRDQLHPESRVFEDDVLVSDPFGAIGGNVLYPRWMLDEVGLFDEDFVGYGCEDGELCYRRHRAGHKVWFEEGAWGLHLAHDRSHVAGGDAATRDVLYRKHPELRPEDLNPEFPKETEAAG